jgi:diguanylate cyclase (GGDEF)-like protein
MVASMGKHGGRWYPALVAILITVYWLTSGLTRNVMYIVVGLCAVGALVLGGRRDRPRRAAWMMFALGVSLAAGGDLVAAWYVATDREMPFPSLADLGYLMQYLCLCSGLALFARKRRPDLAGLLDAAVLSVGGALVLWVALGGSARIGWNAVDLVGLAYPIANITFLTFAVWLATGPPGLIDSGVLRLLTVGICFGLIGDTCYGLSDGTLTPQDRAFGTMYLLMSACWGYAALRSATAAPTPRKPHRNLSHQRLFLTYASLLVVPGVLTLGLARQTLDVDENAVIVAAALLALLVPTRMWHSTRQLEFSTRQRDRYRDDLVHQAAHDPLTDLPNRAYLLELLTPLMYRASRAGHEVALLFVDLDFFKRVNDTLGHAAGDEVLRTTAERMKSVLRAGDVIGRQGGDEFVVLIDPVPSPADLMEIANRIVTVVSVPVVTAAGRAVIGASVGIALARDGEVDPEKLLQDADMAAYRAKANGRGRVEMFDAALRQELEVRLALETEIRTALAEEQFELYYQPVIDVPTRSLYGYEALIRWRHPVRGLVSPIDFIPVAEESMLICEIGAWVLHTATRQLATWTRDDPDGHGRVTVAVNISARHLASRSLIDEVRHSLHASGLPASRLILEITETVLLDEPTADAHLRDLRALGVTISLDDFGTGYTSIGQLQKLQVDTLKIDQSFLHATDPGTLSLLQLMVTAAHAFGLDVVAEGIETQEQLDRLTSIGCEHAQGYFLGRPAPAHDVHTPIPASPIP